MMRSYMISMKRIQKNRFFSLQMQNHTHINVFFGQRKEVHYHIGKFQTGRISDEVRNEQSYQPNK